MAKSKKLFFSRPMFAGQKTCIYGVQGSGKTVFARQKQRLFPNWKKIVYMVNEDDNWIKEDGLWVWQADTNNIKQDFQDFINFIYEKIKEGKIELVIIDEADLFFRHNYDISPKMLDLVLNHRHRGQAGRGVALWFLTRRPQDLPTTIAESSKHTIVYLLEADNALKKLQAIDSRFKEKMKYLSFDEHNFLYKKVGETPILCQSLKFDGKKQVT